MQNHTGHDSMESEFLALRRFVQDKICKYLEGTPNTNLSSEWKQMLPDIAKRLEEAIFKESRNKDDYMNKFQSGIQSQVKYVLNQIQQNQPSLRQHQLHHQPQQQQTMVQHNIQSNSSVSSMMIPKPPGISHNLTGTMRMPSLMESNQGINPTSVPAGIPMSNGYQLSHGNMSIDQPGSTSISASIGVRPPVTPQMIQTPGFNSISTTQVTQQTMPMSNGSGMQPQKQQQYNTLSGQVRPSMQLVPMNQKHSSQGFGDGMMNNNNRLGLLGNNMPQQVSEGYMGIGGTYGDLRRPLQQGFSSLQIQQRMPTSLSEQRASLMGNNIATKHVDMTMSSSGNYYNPEGPSNLSSASHLNKISTIAASLQSKPRPMMLRGGNQLHQQSMHKQYQQLQQQPMMTRGGNQLYQPSMQQQQPMMMGGNQLNQQSMQQQQQPMTTRGGNQLHQQSMQHHHQQQKKQPMMTTGGNQLQQQPMMTMGGNNTFSRQCSLGSISSFGGINTDQAMVESALLTNNHLMLPQHADFKVPFGNNKGGQGQFFDPLSGCNASNQAVSSGELSSLNGVVNNRSRGRVHQPDSMLIQQQSQWRPTQLLQQNNHQMVVDSNNNSHNRNALIEKTQIDQSCTTILSEDVQAPGSSVTTTLVSNEGSSQSQPSHRKTQHLKQMKMILFLFHAISCPAPIGHCRKKNCLEAQQLYKHIERCCEMQCRFCLCLEAKMVLLHFRNCQEENCPVCILHNKLKFMAKHKSLTLKSSCGLKRGINDKEVDNNKVETAAPVALPAPLALKHSRKGINQLDSPKGINKLDSSSGVCSDQMDVEPLPKRPRMDVDISPVSVSNAKSSFSALQEEAFPIEQQTTSNIPAKQETNVTIDPALQNLQIASTESDMSSIQMGHSLDGEVIMIKSSQTDVGPASLSLLVDNEERNDENTTEAKQQGMEEDGASGPSLLVENEERNDKNATEVEQEEMVEDEAADPSLLVENEERNDENESEAKQDEMEEKRAAGKSGKPIINGVSMMELFTPEQVREHIKSLRQWVGQRKSKAEKNQAILMNENSCQLCSIEKLTFEPPPIYCTQCWNRIKRKEKYYTIPNNGQSHYICISCFNAEGENINIEGHVVHKTRVVQKRNNEETEEAWVQCDKCEAWQHQICALFNGRRNEGGQAEYTCPNCYIQEVETGKRKPLPQSAVLGAKDLPRTILSDHIENRLFKRLKEERQDRANYFGKSFDEVQGAEELVVRVVSSVDKRVEVKPRFLEVFRKENYPTEFPYKSKAILLFQKIEGVEVCIFGMYVQEFGTECAFPNQRRVYLSYLDSIKYFRPEIRTVGGEALRTFVYHEILIGYLDYVKRRGFTSCYIWACPPPKCEDYILYCHPKIQKTPKSYILREWYLSMLKKAVNENIVVELTNMYDHCFTNQRESKAKVTAVRLPYFDGDYWPGAAEDMITELSQKEDSHKQNKKGNMKKTTITKRTLKPAGYTDPSVNASMDAMFMHKLAETIFKMKEDLIMVHLQHPCNHCCILMVSGTRWVCNICLSFNLCESCYNVEKLHEDKDRHPIDSSREKHTFRPMEISGVLDDTKDKDDILSEFFDTRQAFLSLCQANHYQFDTLRSAKHSSMMVLYHLHNPTVPAYLTTCTVCSHEIEVGQGWRCEECPDFDVCNSCYQKKEVVNHPHKLTNLPSNVERDAQSKEAQQKRVSQLLRHASECRSPQCQYLNCHKIKGLFRHGIVCQVRINKGCDLCKKMWYLLQLHACACNETVCTIPRCKDLKEQMQRIQQMRGIQQQSESRRRAAVNEMMKQRAAEIFQNQ